MCKHGCCEKCDFKENGMGGIELLTERWCMTLVQDKDTKWVSMAINKDGEQINIPIGYCPECGREL